MTLRLIQRWPMWIAQIPGTPPEPPRWYRDSSGAIQVVSQPHPQLYEVVSLFRLLLDLSIASDVIRLPDVSHRTGVPFEDIVGEIHRTMPAGQAIDRDGNWAVV